MKMRKPTFIEGVGIAAAASLGAGLIFSVMGAMFASGFILRLLIAFIAFLYLLYLLHRSERRIGKVTVITAWMAAAITLWLLGLSFWEYAFAHAGLIWIFRSLYFYSSLFSAFVDLGLVVFGTGSAVWAALQTGSLMVSFWCFFLVQALYVFIPNSFQKRPESQSGNQQKEDRFQQARRSAEAALNKLSIS